MKLSSALIKNIDKDKLCEILLGSIYNEANEKYSITYNYEINEFLIRLEDQLK
jgi:hypothetical protein